MALQAVMSLVFVLLAVSLPKHQEMWIRRPGSLLLSTLLSAKILWESNKR